MCHLVAEVDLDLGGCAGRGYDLLLLYRCLLPLRSVYEHSIAVLIGGTVEDIHEFLFILGLHHMRLCLLLHLLNRCRVLKRLLQITLL